MAEPPHLPPDELGLPPVVPPSGKYIAQLFIVPGLIVAGAVSVLLFFSWMASGPRTPEGFLAGLRNINPEIRWRAASDLAQVLMRDPELAANANFGLDLAVQLKDALPAMRKDTPPASPETAAARGQFMMQRSEVRYLAACLGHMSTPVGAKVLCDVATQVISPDPKTDALLRRQAVWALGEMGHNRKRFTSLSQEKQDQVLAELTRIGAGAGDREEWARSAEESLRGKSSGGVIAALAKCAASNDPFVRKEAALALSFWEGSAEENILANEALMRLTRDDGHGTVIEITKEDEI
ncbi:MAG: hypothetical protein ACJ8C4_14970 [Gemmataceae bacterium]